MLIMIPTLGRADKVERTTLSKFHPATRNGIVLFVQESEALLYSHLPNPIVPLPSSIVELSPTRQYMLEWAHLKGHEKIIMLDDDLQFYHKRPEDATRMLRSDEDHVDKMLFYVEDLLDRYAHVCVGDTLFANNRLTDYQEVGRAMRALAYRTDVLMREGCRFDRLRTKQDLDMAIQLLGKGYKNAMTNKYMQTQNSSQTDGGCSRYRTPELMTADAHRFEELHPGVAKAVRRRTKNSWGGGERWDVRVNWRKAFVPAGLTMDDDFDPLRTYVESVRISE